MFRFLLCYHLMVVADCYDIIRLLSEPSGSQVNANGVCPVTDVIYTYNYTLCVSFTMLFSHLQVCEIT